MYVGVEGASDAQPACDVSVAPNASNEYNELQMKCKAYQEELTEVCIVQSWCIHTDI